LAVQLDLTALAIVVMHGAAARTHVQGLYMSWYIAVSITLLFSSAIAVHKTSTYMYIELWSTILADFPPARTHHSLCTMSLDTGRAAEALRAHAVNHEINPYTAHPAAVHHQF
jgi:hypothetical protein